MSGHATRAAVLLWAARLSVLLVLNSGTLVAEDIQPASTAGASTNSLGTDSFGPTLFLNSGQHVSPGNPLSEFMYFVALISPEPVWVVQSPSNSQRARMISSTRRSTGNSFVVTCDFEFTGQGYERNVFDHAQMIRRNERKLRDGGVLDRQLTSINVEGSGAIAVEVDGLMMGGVPVVNEVRLRFEERGRSSPVTIVLDDIHCVDGSFQTFNQTLARVNSLTFRKQTGAARMEVSVASVHKKDASDSTWEALKGKVKAKAANWIMDPVTIDAAGLQAMINFGLALVTEEAAYKFPRARNLKDGAPAL